MPIEEWDDQRLLHDFVENGAQDSFAELVHRHISWISGTALRALGGDRHLAEDVTQQVFTDFAQKSASLRNHPSMIGWLYQSTRRAAAQTVRTEQRRKMREQLGQLINETAPPSVTAGENLRPLIDEALEALSLNVIGNSYFSATSDIRPSQKLAQTFLSALTQQGCGPKGLWKKCACSWLDEESHPPPQRWLQHSRIKSSSPPPAV